MKETNKFKKKLEKYVNRLNDIVNGKCSKCPNTLANMIQIAEEFGKNPNQITMIYSNLESFTDEMIPALLNILKELMKIESEPNPLSVDLGKDDDSVHWEIENLLEKFSKETESSNYSELIKILTLQPETHRIFLDLDVLKCLIDNIESGDAHVSKNSNEIFESILVSDTHQDIISTFIGEKYEEIMGLMNKLIEHQVPTHQVTGLNVLQTIVNRCGSIKQFSEQYLQDKENLQMVMK